MVLRIVGTNAKVSTIVTRMIENVKELVTAHTTSAASAPAKQTLSERVILRAPCLRDKPKITRLMTVVQPVAQAPGPAWSDNCPTNTIPVMIVHISQLYTWDLVLPRIVSKI